MLISRHMVAQLRISKHSRMRLLKRHRTSIHRKLNSSLFLTPQTRQLQPCVTRRNHSSSLHSPKLAIVFISFIITTTGIKK